MSRQLTLWLADQRYKAGRRTCPDCGVASGTHGERSGVGAHESVSVAEAVPVVSAARRVEDARRGDVVDGVAGSSRGARAGGLRTDRPRPHEDGERRLRQLAILHSLTRAALIRAAVEAWVHGFKTDRIRITHAGLPPRPEPATVPVSVLVTEETAAALATIAIETRSTKTKVIRRALNAWRQSRACRRCLRSRPAGRSGQAPIWSADRVAPRSKALPVGSAWACGKRDGRFRRTTDGFTEPVKPSTPWRGGKGTTRSSL